MDLHIGMHIFEHKIYRIHQEVGDELVWVRALQYPEINRLAAPESHQNQFKKRLIEISEANSIENFGQRVFKAAPEIGQLTIRLKPTEVVQKERCWVDQIELNVPYAAWLCDGELVSAYVPSLDLRVLKRGKLDPKFVGELRKEIRSSLIRGGFLENLTHLPRLHEFGELQLVEDTAQIKLPTAKQIEQEKPDEEQPRELAVVATRIDVAPPAANGNPKKKKKAKRVIRTPLPGFHIESRLKKLAELMQAPDRQSVLLVGPAGVGKTQTIHTLGRRKRNFGLADNQFWETSGSRIVAGMTGFGQWQQRCQKMTEELKKCNGILLLGNLMELLEVGRSSKQSQSVAAWMQTQVQRGALQVVAECTPEQLSIIEQREPQLLGALAEMRIEKPDEELQRKILRSVVEHLAQQLDDDRGDVSVTADGLEMICRLHQRYATYSANPGRSIEFLRRVFEEATPAVNLQTPVEIDTDTVSQAFSAQTGLPHFLLSRSESLNLSELNDWFSQRVIGQSDPCLLYTSPSPRDQRGSRMPSSA